MDGLETTNVSPVLGNICVTRPPPTTLLPPSPKEEGKEGKERKNKRQWKYSAVLYTIGNALAFLPAYPAPLTLCFQDHMC